MEREEVNIVFTTAILELKNTPSHPKKKRKKCNIFNSIHFEYINIIESKNYLIRLTQFWCIWRGTCFLFSQTDKNHLTDRFWLISLGWLKIAITMNRSLCIIKSFTNWLPKKQDVSIWDFFHLQNLFQESLPNYKDFSIPTLGVQIKPVFNQECLNTGSKRSQISGKLTLTY